MWTPMQVTRTIVIIGGLAGMFYGAVLFSGGTLAEGKVSLSAPERLSGTFEGKNAGFFVMGFFSFVTGFALWGTEKVEMAQLREYAKSVSKGKFVEPDTPQAIPSTQSMPSLQENVSQLLQVLEGDNKTPWHTRPQNKRFLIVYAVVALIVLLGVVGIELTPDKTSQAYAASDLARGLGGFALVFMTFAMMAQWISNKDIGT